MLAFLSVVVSKITTTVIPQLAVQEGSLAWGVKGELTKLKESLETIQAVLEDAEERQERVKAVSLWLKKLQDIAYEADDVLDEFAYDFNLPQQLELRDRIMKKVCDFCSPSNPIVLRWQMAHKVKSINMSLDEIKKDAVFGILSTSFRSAVATSQINQNPQETDSSVDDSPVVGRKDDVAKIVKMLTSTGNQQVLSVIAIVGIGGLGKTTLARSVYNNDEINRHFGKKKIWVCVSDIFEDKRILRECLESLNPGKGRMENKDAILKNLREELGGERYLLVLDDVWNEDSGKWKSLKSCLLGLKTNSTGNCVLVTARSNGVALIIETLLPSYRYHLGQLSDDDCWSIFKNEAFPDGGAPMTSELEKIGREIVKKCAGVPLAAKVLGGMMKSKTEKDYWLSVQNNEIWNLPEHQNKILPVLKLSFDHLPLSSLKQCFAYCSMFPKDFVIYKDNLVELWMAQGLLQPPSPESNQEAEDLGYNYFNILLAKSFFQDAKKDLYGSIKNFKMHDLMHDLAQEVSRVDSLTLEPNKDMNGTKEIRHLSLIPKEEILRTIESGRKMRTLFAMDMDVHNMSLSNLKGLRVLNLQGASILELPNSIGKLKHLRYLDVSRTRIKMLPKSIGKLYNLQTLRLVDCEDLERLPNELKNLINLRHFWADWFKEMPIEMGRLTCLQTLPFFIVGQERGRQIEELGRLNQLRGKLNISYLERVMDGEAAKKAKLLMKTNIHELRFYWSNRREREGNNNDEDVLEGLQPHPKLKMLEIAYFNGNKFPSWVMKMMVGDMNILLNDLVEIRLYYCKKCEQIPKLGHLPCLKYLGIEGMDNVKCIQDEFYGYNDKTLVPLFPLLETFSLVRMCNLVEWTEATAMQKAGVVVFPRLKKLFLGTCHQLRTAPTHFSSLRELMIEKISSSMPLEKISSNLTTLTDLKLYDVLELSFLPKGLLQNNKNLASLSIESCPALTSLSIHDCPALTSLSIQYCPSLTSLSIQDCPALTSLSIKDCPSLTSLSIQDCPALTSLSIEDCSSLTSLSIPDVSGCCTSLRSLRIVDCKKLRYLPNGLHNLMSLEELEISECCDLESIPSMHGLTSLHKLKIRGCNALTSLPSGLQYCTILEDLEVHDCPNLISVPKDSLELCSLSNLKIQNCEKLKCLPEGLTGLKSLSIGWLSEELKSLPDELHQHLTSLVILGLDGLEALPGSLGNLEELDIRECPKLKCFPEGLTQLKSLIIDGFSVERQIESLPDQLEDLTALTHLKISNFRKIEALPESLGDLCSLQFLAIYHCENLMYLPTEQAMRRLSKLQVLEIADCRLLQERCARGSRPEWFKISHIPEVKFSYRDGPFLSI